MEQRILGRGGFPVSVVGLGTWQLGADWGDVEESDALAVLDAAAQAGVTFFDTADVYGDGRSEKLIGAWLRDNPDYPVHVATKMGRRLPQELENYRIENFLPWLDRSRSNLKQDTLELVQLHCPPDSVFDSEQVFDQLDELVSTEVIARYGVSVETTDQALRAMARPNVVSVQIIANAFRLKPFDEVIPTAHKLGVGIIARVPLASGLLSGRYTAGTVFSENDHRNYNRHGEAFDVGETFSGVPYDDGVQAAQEFSTLVAEMLPNATPAQAAIAWLVSRGVSTVIPGARNVAQAEANAAAAAVTIPDGFDEKVAALYDRYFRREIHPRW